jgi:hypothetical protein
MYHSRSMIHVRKCSSIEMLAIERNLHDDIFRPVMGCQRGGDHIHQATYDEFECGVCYILVLVGARDHGYHISYDAVIVRIRSLFFRVVYGYARGIYPDTAKLDLAFMSVSVCVWQRVFIRQNNVMSANELGFIRFRGMRMCIYMYIHNSPCDRSIHTSAL